MICDGACDVIVHVYGVIVVIKNGTLKEPKDPKLGSYPQTGPMAKH